jgi:hypothetical protein
MDSRAATGRSPDIRSVNAAGLISITPSCMDRGEVLRDVMKKWKSITCPDVFELYEPCSNAC